jgi:hypothetical protein
MDEDIMDTVRKHIEDLKEKKDKNIIKSMERAFQLSKVLNPFLVFLDEVENEDREMMKVFLITVISSLILSCANNFDEAITIVKEIEKIIIDQEKDIHKLQDGELNG